MNTKILEGKWDQIKGKLKEKYGELTDDDLTYEKGKFDEMLGKIKEKTGKSVEEMTKDLKGGLGSMF